MNPIPATVAPHAIGHPLDHVGLAVADLEAAADAYAALGWSAEGRDEEIAAQGVRVRMLRGGPGPALELLAPLGGEGPIARFLDRRGPGLHHLAFSVPDLAAEMDRLRAQDAPLVDAAPRPGHGGTRVAFVHPRWTGGVLVELVERG